LVMRQMSNLLSNSCHTHCNIWRSIAATASTIHRCSCGKSRGIGGTYVPPMIRDLPCVAGTWLQDWHLLRHQGWTYQAPVRYDRKLECLSLWWHAPLRRDHPGYCTAEVGNPRGTYELPFIQ
jgi:hypothetical protein